MAFRCSVRNIRALSGLSGGSSLQNAVASLRIAGGLRLATGGRMVLLLRCLATHSGESLLLVSCGSLLVAT